MVIIISQCDISIHALREEGDLAKFDEKTGLFEFLSTPSARRATSHVRSLLSKLKDFYPRPPRGGRPEQCSHKRPFGRISIHALREEGDQRCQDTQR